MERIRIIALMLGFSSEIPTRVYTVTDENASPSSPIDIPVFCHHRSLCSSLSLFLAGVCDVSPCKLGGNYRKSTHSVRLFFIALHRPSFRAQRSPELRLGTGINCENVKNRHRMFPCIRQKCGNTAYLRILFYFRLRAFCRSSGSEHRTRSFSKNAYRCV